ncbi:hypothetical protein JOM56_002797 [Amanita muscaria]
MKGNNFTGKNPSWGIPCEVPRPRSASPVSETGQETLPALPVTTSSPKIAIIISSMYGHIAKMAEAAKQSVEKAGGQASIFQIAENLSPEILAKMHSPPKPDYPIINLNDLTNYDGCLFGVPTRCPAQWKVCVLF